MRKMQTTTRRDFLRGSASLAGAAILAPAIVPASVFGADAPSERITVGAIGVGRMGNGDLGEALGLGDVQVLAVCDVDANRVKAAKERVEKAQEYAAYLREIWNTATE